MINDEIERRSSFRIRVFATENGAGLAVGKSVFPAELVDFSREGCCVALPNKYVEIGIGSEVQVAIPNGQYLGNIRHTELDLTGGAFRVGIKFSEEVELRENKPLTRSFADERVGETADSKSFSFLLAAMVIFWIVIAVLSYAFFGNSISFQGFQRLIMLV